MDEGQHVGDDLDHRGRAERPHVEDLAAHRLERRPVRLEERRVAADQHGDLAGRGEMHAAGDRAIPACATPLAAASAARRRTSSRPSVLISIQVPPGLQAGEDAIGTAEHLLRHGGRRQAGDDRVALAWPAPRRIGPGRARLDMALGEPRFEVVDRRAESRRAAGSPARCAAEMAEADIAVAHVVMVHRGLRALSVISRCSLCRCRDARSATSSFSSMPRPGSVGGMT